MNNTRANAIGMRNERVDAAPIDDFISAAKRGSNRAYLSALAKLSGAKRSYRFIKGCMTQAERDAFWANVRRCEAELSEIKRLVTLS